MSEELNIDSLKSMNKAEFIKAFKDKPQWKKAKAVIVFVDFRLNGKKCTVAIPYKKETVMKSEMKRVKNQKIHLFKKSGGGRINFDLENGELVAKIELTQGGLKPEKLKEEGTELFGRIKSVLKVLIAEDSETEPTHEEEDDEEFDVDPNHSATESPKRSEIEEKELLKSSIQELARLQLSLKGEWEQFKKKAKDEGLKFSLPLLGKLKANLKIFKSKIDELAKLQGAENEVKLFTKNYEALNNQLANPAFEKANTALETVKQNTITMVNDINMFIDKIRFDAYFKIKI